MVVVVAIAAMIAAVSLPSATAGIDSVRLASASGSIAAFLNAAVNRVERRQEPLEVVIERKTSRLVLYSNEPGFERELKLPDGVAIEALQDGRPDDEENPDAPYRLLLLPGAPTPGLGIQIVNRHGSRRLIHLDPMTGFPRVESVVAKR